MNKNKFEQIFSSYVLGSSEPVKEVWLDNCCWGPVKANENSIVFFHAKDENELLRLTQSCKAYGLVVINSAVFPTNQCNVIFVDNHKFLLLQKAVCDRFYPINLEENKLIAITGTNGKTTTVHFCLELLGQHNITAFSVGSLGVRSNHLDINIPLDYTTPPFIELRKILFQYFKTHRFAFLEVSSHALVQSRVFGLVFACAGWTSFSQDHLDFHKDMHDYFLAKCLLIKNYLNQYSSLYVPRRKPELFEMINHECPDRVRTTVELKLKMDDLTDFLRVSFNQDNLEIAVSIIQELLDKQMNFEFDLLTSPKGRFSTHIIKDRFFIIDSAHTPDALLKIISAAKSVYPKRQLLVVFGCGGDRDKAKRPLMAQVVEENCDFAIVTSDNSRNEIPQDIISDIVQGFTLQKYTVCVDRKKAILKSFEMSEKGSVILIAGKGAEEYMEEKGLKRPFSDQQVLDELKSLYNWPVEPI